MKKQNIIVALLIGALVGFLGYSVLDNNIDKSTDNITNNQVEIATETSEETASAIENDLTLSTEGVPVSTESSTEINTELVEDMNISEEDMKIEEANPEDSEYIICIIRKNDLGDSTTYDIVSNTIAKNHYIGSMTLKFDSVLLPDAEISEDNTVTENNEQTETTEQAETNINSTDVKNLELGKYYVVTTAVEIEQGPIITINNIREADEYEVKNFEKGRVQNSTFTTDFEQLKLMEPKEALEKSLTLQYTWSFEQIEVFKAYVESKKAESEESKVIWEEAEKEIDLDLGY